MFISIHELVVQEECPDSVHQLPLAEGICLVCRGFPKYANIDFLEITGELSQNIQP